MNILRSFYYLLKAYAMYFFLVLFISVVNNTLAWPISVNVAGSGRIHGDELVHASEGAQAALATLLSPQWSQTWQCTSENAEALSSTEEEQLGCSKINSESQRSYHTRVNQDEGEVLDGMAIAPNYGGEAPPTCISRIQQAVSNIEEGVKATVKFGTRVCKCCDDPTACFSSDPQIGGAMQALKLIQSASLIGTGVGVVRGYKKLCKALTIVQTGFAGVNATASMMCYNRANKCDNYHQQCLQEIERVVSEIQPCSAESTTQSKSYLFEEEKESLEKAKQELETSRLRYCKDTRESAALLRNSALLLGGAAVLSNHCAERKKNENLWDECHEKPEYPKCCAVFPNHSECPSPDICDRNPECCAEGLNMSPEQCMRCKGGMAFAPECADYCKKYPNYRGCPGAKTPPCVDPNDPDCKVDTDDDDPTNGGGDILSSEDDGSGDDLENPNPDEPLFGPPPLPLPKKKPTGGSGSSKRTYTAGGGPGGGGLGGGLGGMPGGGGSGEEEGEGEGEGEEANPYKNLLKGLTGGKNQLTGGGGSGSLGRNNANNAKQPKFNLKKFLPKKKKDDPSKRGVASLLKGKSIFDIHSEVVHGYCSKNQVECAQAKK